MTLMLYLELMQLNLQMLVVVMIYLIKMMNIFLLDNIHYIN